MRRRPISCWYASLVRAGIPYSKESSARSVVLLPASLGPYTSCSAAGLAEKSSLALLNGP